MSTPFRRLNEPDPAITPLMQAAFSTQTSVEAMLELAHEHDPLAIDRDGRTALMLAAWQGGAAKVRALLPLSDAQAVDHKGVNALMIASGMGDPERVAALIEASAPAARDHQGMNALMHAVRGGKVANVPMLALVCPVDARDEDRNTLFAHALRAGPKTLQTVLPLLPVDTPNQGGQTALMLAAQTPAKAAQVLLPILLRAGADPSCVDARGMTALHHAAATSATALDLLWAPSDPAARDAQGQTLLHHAAMGSDPEALATVLDAWPAHRADVPDTGGNTALLRACERAPDSQNVAMLLAAGANPNQTNGQGLTPLLALVKAGADVNALNDEDVLRHLLTAGARVDARDAEGQGVLDLLVVIEDEGTMLNGSWSMLMGLLPHLPEAEVLAWATAKGLLDLDDPESDDYDRRAALHIQLEQRVLRQALPMPVPVLDGPGSLRDRPRL